MLFEFCGRADGAELRRRGAATQPVAPFNVDGIPGEINGNFSARKKIGFQAPGNIEGGDLLRCGSSTPICMKIKFPIIYTAGGLRFLKRLLAWCDSLYTRSPIPCSSAYASHIHRVYVCDHRRPGHRLARSWAQTPGGQQLPASGAKGGGNATQ